MSSASGDKEAEIESPDNIIDESLFIKGFEDCLKIMDGATKEQTSKANKCDKDKSNVLLKKASNPKDCKKVVLTNKSKKFRFVDSEQVTQTAKEPESRPTINQAPIMPPPFDGSSFPLSENLEEAKASMMMSWYMAGYHTGYYEAMQKFKQ